MFLYLQGEKKKQCDKEYVNSTYHQSYTSTDRQTACSVICMQNIEHRKVNTFHHCEKSKPIQGVINIKKFYEGFEQIFGI